MPSTEPDVSARGRARAYWIVVAAISLSIAIIDALAPIQGEDWTPRYWLLRRGAGLGSLASYVWHHRIVGDLVELLLSGAPWSHAVVTPALAIAFVVGLVAIGCGRVPRPRDPDGWLHVLLASALVWLGAPRAGIDFFFRAYVAHFLAGLTAVVWLLFVVLHVDVRRGVGRAIACGVLGLVAGTSNHYLVPVVLWVIASDLRARRAQGPIPAWRWSALGGLVAGGVLLFTQRPYIPLRSIVRGGFEHNLYKLYLFMGECGELVAVVLLFFFVITLRARLRPPGPPAPDARAIRLAGRALGLAIIVAFVSVLSPRWGEPAMLAPMGAMVASTIALWQAPLADRRVRVVLASLAVVVHVLVMVYALPRYLEVHREYGDRIAILESTAPGGVARVPPYRKSVQDSWFLGDDFMTSGVRGLVAEIEGLRTIELTEPIGSLQASAGYHFDEVFSTGERVPMLTDDLEIARAVFAEDVLARWRGGWRGDARLELLDLQWPDRRGRRLVAERYHGDEREMYTPVADVRPFDKSERLRMGFDLDSLDGDYPDTVVVEGDRALVSSVDDEVVTFAPENSDRYVLLRCKSDECWVVMAPWIQI